MKWDLIQQYPGCQFTAPACQFTAPAIKLLLHEVVSIVSKVFKKVQSTQLLCRIFMPLTNLE